MLNLGNSYFVSLKAHCDGYFRDIYKVSLCLQILPP